MVLGQDGILQKVQKNVELWVCKIIYFWWWICGKTLWLSSSKAFQCLDSICQLNILDELEKSLDKYFKAQVIETDKSKAKTPAAITKAVNEKEKLEEKINKYEETLVNNEKEIQRIKKEVANLEKEINEDDGLQGSLKKDYEEKKK